MADIVRDILFHIAEYKTALGSRARYWANELLRKDIDELFHLYWVASAEVIDIFKQTPARVFETM